ncbi:MAG: hypothetical protein HC880_11115 [Bacteroidia bacterium]|nr:hypothetical protein [Bacteroidia bacterium]
MSEILREFILRFLGFNTPKEIVEELYLKAFLDPFERIQQQNIQVVEEKIRDLFIRDFETENLVVKNLLKERTIILTWER